MMDGRVKTLHPKVHGGILARRHRPDDLAALDAHGIAPIDLVVVNLYPFAKAAARAGPRRSTTSSRRSTSAGRAWCARRPRTFATCWSSSIRRTTTRVLDALARPAGRTLGVPVRSGAQRAFAHTAAYDAMIAAHARARCASTTHAADVHARCARRATRRRCRRCWRRGSRRSATCGTARIRTSRRRGTPRAARAGFGAATVHQGKELSFTNLLDLDAAARIALEFDEPAAVVIKHTNPCGVATGASLAEAYVRARDADPLSAFGGIVGLNRADRCGDGRALTSTFIEAVIAPGIVGVAGRAALRSRRKPICAW